jgi:hypothetical protein
VESIPKHEGMVPKSKEQWDVGMQLEENLVAAQLGTWWVQKFALQLIELANQLVEDGMVEKKSERIDEIRQSWVIVGLLMARLTVRELPSKITWDSCIEEQSWAARRAAVASPYKGVHGGLTLVIHLRMNPFESRHTADCTKKLVRMVVS